MFKETTSKRKQKVIKGYTILVLWTLLLTPSIQTLEGLPSLRIDDILLIVAPFFVATTLSRIELDFRVFLILLIALSIEAGILTGAIIGYPASLLDHFFLIRLLKYTGAIILASALVTSFDSPYDALKWVLKRSFIPGLILVLVIIQQYFNLGEINELYTQYVAPTKHRTLVGNYPTPRPVGLIGNPNQLSFLLGILSLAAAWMLFEESRKRTLHILLITLFILAAFSTLSRSGTFSAFGALALLIGIKVLSSLKTKSNKITLDRNPAILGAVSLLSLIALLTIMSMNDTLRNEIVWRFMPEHYGSFYARVENWHENIQLWSESPLIGVGTLKHSNFLEHAADNEWLLLGRIGGVFLIILVILLFTAGLFRNTGHRDTRHFHQALVFGSALFMIPGAVFYNEVIMPMILIFLTTGTPLAWRSIKFSKLNQRRLPPSNHHQFQHSEALNMIAHLTTVHPRTDTRIRIKEVASLGTKFKGSVMLFVQDGEGNEFQNTPPLQIIDTGLRPAGRLARMTKGAWRMYRAVLKAKPEIAHFHDPELIPIAFALKLSGIKIIYDVHEDVPRQILGKRWLRAWLRHPISRLVEGVEWMAARVFDGIVTASPTISNRFPRPKTVTIKNFPVLSELAASDSSPYSERPPYFAYVGGITPARGAHEMVQAIGQVVDQTARLQLAGEFSSANTRQKAEQLNGWLRVDFHGWASRKQVSELLGQARAGLVVLHPTANYPDAYPVKMFEYMAASLPVIASDFPLWRKIVEDAECGLLVDPLNPAEIAEAMQWLMDHPDQAEAMGKRGRQAVEQTYNWEAESQKLIEFYCQLFNINVVNN